MSDVTRILNVIEQGDTQTAAELLPLVYDELRRLAAAKMANEAAGHTLQPTALVHEAWLRLVGNQNQKWDGRAHFFAAAAEAKRDGWEVSVSADPERNGGLLLHADRFRRSGRFTLVMHTGLVVMLLGAAASGIFGYTQGILLTDGEALPVGKIGTADGLVIVNHAFSAPRTSTGAFADFSTDLGVYVGGEEVARQMVRVNEPLAYNGWSFHQNFFGPAARLEIRDDTGALLWSGDAPFAAQVDGAPYATLPIPGSSAGIEMQLRRDASGAAARWRNRS